VIENAFAGTNFGRTDFRVILAEVILKTNCSYHCGHTATSIAAGLGLITSRNRTISGFDAGWKSTKAGHEFAIDAYYTNRPGSVVRQLKDAEARIAELTADLDKESEIRHRIHEELNAIKGEQQPIYQVEVLEGRVDYSKPEFDKMIVGDFPCTGKRVLFTHPAPEVLPVVELTDSTLAEVVRAWNRADYPASAYPAMREVLRAAGLEVKS